MIALSGHNGTITRAGIGIGTLGEKTLHRELKWYLEPRGARHEVRVGRYVADIMSERRITEIQTRALYKMKTKLTAFLTEYEVTLVYPIVRVKRIYKAGTPPVTGIAGDAGDAADAVRVSRPRLSPKHGCYCDALRELYGIKELLTNPNLTVRLILVDVSELRTAGKNRRGYTRADVSLDAIEGDLTVSCAGDYRLLIPESLRGEPAPKQSTLQQSRQPTPQQPAPPEFTSQDFASASRTNIANAGIALNVLCHVGAVTRVGRRGRYFLYTASE